MQATSLRQVADDLQGSLNQMTRNDNLPITNATQQRRVAGYFFSTVILRALATEIMLKALPFKKTGKY